jgi:hypothetical protein
MTCSRCQGFLVPEVLQDYIGTYFRYEAWRCVNCGEIFDSVIAQHRLEHPCNQHVRERWPSEFRPTAATSAR